MLSSDIKPEQKRALAIVETQRLYFNNNYIDINNITLEQIITYNSKLFIYGNISGFLPHGDTWKWKQSSSRLHTTLSNNDSIILKKLHTSSTSNPSCKPPSYKIWICEFIDVVINNKPLFFCWCEKGKISPTPLITPVTNIIQQSSPNTIDNNDSNDDNEELDIKDYAFLKDHIDPSLAKEFGWI